MTNSVKNLARKNKLRLNNSVLNDVITQGITAIYQLLMCSYLSPSHAASASAVYLLVGNIVESP